MEGGPSGTRDNRGLPSRFRDRPARAAAAVTRAE